MLERYLADGILLEQTEDHIHVAFDTPRSVISSAVLNGGAVEANHMLNLKVRDQFKNGLNAEQPPEITLANYCKKLCNYRVR
jgi:adenosylcobinamide amidohydrolase